MLNQAIFESPRQSRTKLSFEVKINNTEFITKIAHFEAKEQLRIVRYASNFETVPEVDMEKYLKNLLYYRVQSARGERIEPSAMKPLLKRLYVPARWYTMLDHIGEAHDAVRNIKFYPVYELPAVDMLSIEQMMAISEIMSYIKPEGYTCVQGVPVHMEGSLEFMAKVALADNTTLDTIRGMDVHNPVFGFFASIFRLEVLGLTYKELELMYRVEYSAENVYMGQINDYYRSVMSNGTNNQPVTVPSQPEPGAI